LVERMPPWLVLLILTLTYDVWLPAGLVTP
jgi:hypothetical protein